MEDLEDDVWKLGEILLNGREEGNNVVAVEAFVGDGARMGIGDLGIAIAKSGIAGREGSVNRARRFALRGEWGQHALEIRDRNSRSETDQMALNHERELRLIIVAMVHPRARFPARSNLDVSRLRVSLTPRD
jgi:hypothetical protein